MNSTGIARYFPRCAEQVHVHHVTTESSNEVKYKCSVKALQHDVILRNIEIFFDVVFGWCVIRTNNLTQTF